MDFIGKYRVVRELGKGATAVVYLCDDPDNERQVAVKLVRFDSENIAMSRRLRKLFRTEGLATQRLDHPNIVKVYESVIEEEQAYIVMEYIQGGSLEPFCSIDKLMPMHRVIGIVFKCCLALDHAYRQGIVHRDIKPANIMLDQDDNPKITDFGLALNVNKDLGRDSTFIMGVGSPVYMSPEQIKAYPLNHKTDLYSLGVVLFQMLTGRLPFRANNPATLVYKIVNMDTPSICALNPNLPTGLDPIIRKALEKDLYGRYRNGAEFAKDLSAVRYQILEEYEPEQDLRYFQMLRKMEFFTEFDNVELWEILRVAIWRDVDRQVTLIQEGEEVPFFAIIASGSVEVSVDGKAIARLAAGEPVGEMAFLHPSDRKRYATVVTLESCRLLEINAAALALASDELQERMREALMVKVLTRLRELNYLVAQTGRAAVKGKGKPPPSAFDLELLPM